MQNIRVFPAVHLYSISIETNAAQEVGEIKAPMEGCPGSRIHFESVDEQLSHFVSLPPYETARLCHLVLA
jgi:hypothetical protein